MAKFQSGQTAGSRPNGGRVDRDAVKEKVKDCRRQYQALTTLLWDVQELRCRVEHLRRQCYDAYCESQRLDRQGKALVAYTVGDTGVLRAVQELLGFCRYGLAQAEDSVSVLLVFRNIIENGILFPLQKIDDAMRLDAPPVTPEQYDRNLGAVPEIDDLGARLHAVYARCRQFTENRMVPERDRMEEYRKAYRGLVDCGEEFAALQRELQRRHTQMDRERARMDDLCRQRRESARQIRVDPNTRLYQSVYGNLRALRLEAPAPSVWERLDRAACEERVTACAQELRGAVERSGGGDQFRYVFWHQAADNTERETWFQCGSGGGLPAVLRGREILYTGNRTPEESAGDHSDGGA